MLPSSATGTRICRADDEESVSGMDLEVTFPTLKPPEFELKRHLDTLMVGQVFEDDAGLFDADVEQLCGDFLGESEEIPDFGVLVKFSWVISAGGWPGWT